MTLWPFNTLDWENVEYPTSDGEPMGETDLHRDLMIDLIEALKFHYRAEKETYVSGNIILYYEEGNPMACLSPDVLVTPGITSEPRETYKMWVIGKAPELVVEVTSRSTRMRDIGLKKGLYEAMGVQEYLLFDPRSDYLSPRFQVFRLEGGFYVSCLAPEQKGYESRLGLTFRVVDDVLRIARTSTGELLPRPRDLAERAEAATERAEAATERAEAATAKAEAATAKAERLAEKLRELGVDPDA